MDGQSIAKIPCGASIPCGDWQGGFAYSPREMAESPDKDPVAERIGRTIAAAIARLDVDNTKIGLALGKQRQNVQHWVKGRHLPKASELPQLCELLGIDANELLSVPPKPALTGPALEAHRQWLLEKAAQTRTLRHGETAPRKAQGKSSRLRAV